MGERLIAKMTEINVMDPIAAVAVRLNVPVEGAGALAREKKQMIGETIVTKAIKTTDVHAMDLVTQEIRGQHPERVTTDRRKGQQPIRMNIGPQLGVGGAAEEEAMSIVHHDQVEVPVVTAIVIIVDQLLPEKAIIDHREVTIPEERMAYPAAEEEPELIVLPMDRPVELVPMTVAAEMIMKEIDAKLLHMVMNPTKLPDFEDWRSPKHPYLKTATSLPSCALKMKVLMNQTVETIKRRISANKIKRKDQLNDYTRKRKKKRKTPRITTQFFSTIFVILLTISPLLYFPGALFFLSSPVKKAVFQLFSPGV